MDAEDIGRVETALNRYPPEWVHAAVGRGPWSGEPLPTIRMVGTGSMPPEAQKVSGARGYYEASNNTLFIDVEQLNRYDQVYGPSGTQNPNRPGYGSRNELLARTAIHEFAHFLDDAGAVDRHPKGQRPIRMATEEGPVRRYKVGAFTREQHRPGLFEQRVRRRNIQTSDPQDYASDYDHSRNVGRDGMAQPKETFAEITTRLVLEGDVARQRLLADPTSGPLTRQVLDYLERNLDPRALSHPPLAPR